MQDRLSDINTLSFLLIANAKWYYGEFACGRDENLVALRTYILPWNLLSM